MRKQPYNIISSKVIDLFFTTYSGSGENKFRTRFNCNMSFFNFVFLCGGKYEEYSSRDILVKMLEEDKGIKVIISEQLLLTRGSLDLLTFEIILEAISKMVLICLESMGSACELGAFSNIGDSNKEVVIINKEFASDKSFINDGPVEYLRSKNDDRVIITKFKKDPNKKICIEVNSEILNIPKHHLIKDGYKIATYYKKDENGNLIIVNLSTFSAVVLDYLCLFLIGNPSDFLYFLKRLYDCNAILIDSNNITDATKIPLIIETIMNIYVELGFLRKDEGYYFVNGNTIMSDMKEKWIGELIFTAKETESKEFLSFKAKASLLTRSCYAVK